MLKLRLKKTGKKRSPSYRLVIMENNFRRDGKPIDEVGYYNPITKKYKFETEKIKKWLSYGVKPTETVLTLLKKAEILLALDSLKIKKKTKID
jgi:small subunit ribosomal protein S16